MTRKNNMNDKAKSLTHIFSGRHTYAMLEHVVKGIAPDYWDTPSKFSSVYAVIDLPVIFPEIIHKTKYHRHNSQKVPVPRHPADLVAACHMFIGKTVVTFSEHVILYMLRQVADKKMKHTDLQITFVEANGEYKVIRVDETGELIDRWPGGFFDERADLLFGTMSESDMAATAEMEVEVDD